MAIESYIVLQGDVADSGELSDVSLSGAAEFELLVRNGSNQWVNQTIATASIDDNAITYAKAQDVSAASRVLGRGSAGGAGNPEELTLGSSMVMNTLSIERAALTGDVTATQDSNATTIAPDSVSFDKMLDATAASRIIGRGSAGGAGTFEELTIGASFVLNTLSLERAALTGDVTASQNSNATTIAAGVVTLAKIADAAANDKLLGSGNAGSGNPYVELTLGAGLTMTGTTLSASASAPALNDITDVTLTTPDTNSVLIKSAGDWIDGLIVTSSITDANVTLAKIVNVSAASRLIGRGSAGGAGVQEEITVGTSLNFDGTNLERAAISGDVVVPLDSNTATIQPDSVVFDMLLDATGSAKIIGRGDGGVGTFEELTIGSGLTITGTVLDSTAHSSAGLSGYVMFLDAGNEAVVADHTDRVQNGNTRGDSAVDLQTDRSGVGKVAVGANSTIGGGESNETVKTHGTVPGGLQGTSRRFGELAYGGASASDGQRVMNVATLRTSDATPTIMGYTTGAGWTVTTTLDAATIPFPSSGTYMLAVEGYVIGMRGESASDEACCFKIEFAVKKNNAGTVSFVGNPKVSVVGRDDANLDCDVVLAGSNAGTNIRVTGIAAQEWVWTFEYEGAEMLVPAL